MVDAMRSAMLMRIMISAFNPCCMHKGYDSCSVCDCYHASLVLALGGGEKRAWYQLRAM